MGAAGGLVAGADVLADGVTVVTVADLGLSRTTVLWLRAKRLFGWRDPIERHMLPWVLEQSPNGDVAIINFKRDQRLDIPADQLATILAILSRR